MPVNQAEIERTLMDLGGRVDRIEQFLPTLLTRGEFQIAIAEVGRHFVVLRDELIARMDTGDDETRRQMRVLHEEVISRIALLHESLNERGPIIGA